MRASLHPPGHDRAWFVVLPDGDAARGVAAALGAHAPQALAYPSGRDWLLGRWAADELVTAQVAEAAHVAVIGCSPVTPATLSAMADQVRTVADLDRLAAGLSGSFHLVAAVDGQVRVQGSVSGLRRVFHAEVGTVTIAADRADVLASLAAAAVDEQYLAARLVYPYLPYPVADGCLWHGMQALPTR